MPRPSLSLIQCIYKMAGAYRDDTRTDAELLTRYAESQDEFAFRALMVRHGGMVWSICRHMLRNTEDVEEAFQTIFLALARKANKVNVNVVGWLHQVTHQTALNARRNVKTRRKLQEVAGKRCIVQNPSENYQLEAYEELHTEIAKLPENLRVALVLHYLEGKTQLEVAQILGVDESAVWQRINRGKVILEKRLIQKGLAIGAAGLATMLAEAASDAAMPPGLVGKTMLAATAFREGNLCRGLAKLSHEVLKRSSSTTPWRKSAWIITILCVGGLGVGVGGVAWKTGFFDLGADGLSAVAKEVPVPLAEDKRPRPKRLDLYGDPLPSGALARFGALRLRVTGKEWWGGAEGVAFTSNGKCLLSWSQEASVHLWDAVAGKLVRKFASHLSAAAVSKNGDVLATRSNRPGDGLRLWEVKTGKLIRRIQGAEGNGSATLAVSPDGKSVASIVGAGAPALEVYDVASGELIWQFKKIGGGFSSLAYSSDGKYLSGCVMDCLYVWNALTGERLRVWTDKDKYHPAGFACSHDDRLAAVRYARTANGAGAGEENDFISLCDRSTGKELRRIPAPGQTTPVFSPDDKILVSVIGSHPYVICFWDVATGKQVRQIKTSHAGDPFAPWQFAFAPDGKVLAGQCCYSTDRTIHFWDVQSGKELPASFGGHRAQIVSLAFTETGDDIVSAGDDGVIFQWEAATGKEKARFGSPDGGVARPWPAFPTVSPDARTVAFADVDWTNGSAPVATMTVMRREGALPGKELGRCQVAAFSPGVISPNSDWWAAVPTGTSSVGGNVRVRKLATGAERTLHGSYQIVAFSPNSEVIATGAWDHNRSPGSTVTLWNIRTDDHHEVIAPSTLLKRPQSQPKIESLAFSSTGGALAIAANDGDPQAGGSGEIQLWPLFKGPSGSWYANSVCLTIPQRAELLIFSPDSKTIAAAHGCEISLLETASGRERVRFEGQEGEIKALAFAPDGRRLASGGKDATALVWDVTGRLEQDRLRSASSERVLDSLWKDLAGADAARAGRAIWSLVFSGPGAVDFFAKRLRPAVTKDVSAATVVKLIADLDANAFQTRVQAQQKLTALGEPAAAYLRKALQKSPSVETRKRLQELLKPMEAGRAKVLDAGDDLRAVRAIEVLEQIGSANAQRLLKTLASGAEDCRQTMEAQQSLARLTRTRRN